mmetsp:Transcript_9199/g.19105  ORF Transcript_9199/g.19105 Transcript_9199/m.19105 type:complete len:959 (+) Transcript_9199:212-3088(+)
MAAEADGLANDEGDDASTNEFHRDSRFSTVSPSAAANGDCPHDDDDDDDVISSNDGEDDVLAETPRRPQQQRMTTTQSKTAPIPQSSSTKSKTAMALIKLRAWDPARPTRQFKMIAAAHVTVPLKEDGSVDLGNDENSSSSSSAEVDRADSRGEGSLSSSVKRLSAVEEEMEGELEEFPTLKRKGTIGSSLREHYKEVEGDHCNQGDEVGTNRAVKEDRSTLKPTSNKSMNAKDDTFLEHELDGDVGSGPLADQEHDDEERDPPRNNLEAGSLIGIQLNPLASISKQQERRHQKHQPATSSHTSSVTNATSSSHTMKRQFDWAVGQRVHLHKLNLLPFANWAELYYRIDSNSSSLRELILDGLPPGCMSAEEASVVIEALGTNTSIKRFSMRYAQVDDEIASHIALALVENTTLTQLVLEGNSMTDVSVRNFYSVLRKSNESLRLLDASHNPMINADVAETLDQYMEQRALKRMLNLKAEKAKRAAKGLPPDESLDEDEDEEGSNPVHLNSITVVCNPSIIDGTFNPKGMVKMRGASPGSGQDMGPTLFIGSASKTSDVTSLEDPTTCDEENDDNEDANHETRRNLNPSALSLEKDAFYIRHEGDQSLKAEPYPNESFDTFMNRMSVIKADNSDFSPYNRKLQEQSEAGVERFENYGSVKNTPELYSKIQPYPFPFQQNRSLPLPQNDPNMRQSNVSFNSSITSRSSPHYTADNDTNSITSEERPGLNGAITTVRAAASGIDSVKAATASASSSTLEPLDQPSPAHLPTHPQSASLPANSNPHPVYRDAFSSLSRGESVRSGFSNEMQHKRKQSSAPDCVGAHQVNEPAPARQSQQIRRNRTRRTESQRRARLAALTDGGDGDANATANVRNDGGATNGAAALSMQTTTANNDHVQIQTNEILNADIQRLGDEYYRDLEDPDFKNGYFGGEYGTDKMICLLMGFLAIAMIVMIVLLVT